MARRLPDDPVKRRLAFFKRIYQHIEHWHALMEDRGMSDVITTPDGEDIYLGDLMVGWDRLPKRQRQAFRLICMGGYTETDARDELLPNSVSSTPVQQYADSGLIRMVWAYDLKQKGEWPPIEEPRPVKVKTPRRSLMSVLHPLVKQGLEATRKKILAEIEGLQMALAQVEAMLGGTTAVSPPASHPAPNPKPDSKQKPTLQEMAKELASTG